MASLFVSRSSRDRAAAERICTRLRAVGFVALFVDFDPEQGIPAGRNWEQELYAQLRRTDAVIFLASVAAVASRWCFAEISLARSLRRPIFPVRLQPGVHLPLLAELQAADKLDWPKAMIDRTYRRPLTTTEAGSMGSRRMRARRRPPCPPAR